MKKLIILLVAFLMLVFCNATVSQAVTITFDPGVSIGSVDVVISGLGDGEAPSLGAFDIDIGYNPTLPFSFYALGSYLGDIDYFEADDLSLGNYSLGVINISELSWLLGNASDDLNNLGGGYLDDIQTSSFTLATLTFAQSLDTSSLAISSYVLSDAYGESITLVPEPATLFLLGTGLAGIGFLRKKRMNRVSL